MMCRLFWGLGFAVLGLGCAANTAGTGFGGSGGVGLGGAGSVGGGTASMGGSAPSGTGGGGSSSVGFTTGTGGTGVGGGGTGGSGTTVYLHTDKTLYTLDPNSPSTPPTEIGKFDCVGGNNQDDSITDVAVTSAGDIWGVSKSSVYQFQIQGSTVHCAQIIPLTLASASVSFYALTFAPKGVLDPNLEVLVAGNTAGELWSIDAGGTPTQRGTFGNVPANDGRGHNYDAGNVGQAWELSGDIVFLANGTSPVGFATVRDCPSPPSRSNCNNTDTLLEIDMTKIGTATTQSVTKSVRGLIVPSTSGCNTGGASGFGGIFGIAAWDSKIYGFSQNGDIVSIDNDDGTACLLQSNASTIWFGAGVSTKAPVIVPPPA